MSDDTTPTDEPGEEQKTPAEEPVLLSFRSTTAADQNGTIRDAVHVEVSQSDDSDETSEIEQYESLPEKSPLHEKVLCKCEELGIEPRLIEFPVVSSPKTDKHGDRYITDIRGLIRYYFDNEQVVTTGRYDEAEFIAVDSTQRKNDLSQMLGRA